MNVRTKNLNILLNKFRQYQILASTRTKRDELYKDLISEIYYRQNVWTADNIQQMPHMAKTG